MTRFLLFVVLAAALVAYAYWVYLRVELKVAGARGLALVRAAVLVVVLLLLFDPEIPSAGGGTSSARWALLDASLSMAARDGSGTAAWEGAAARAAELRADGWNVVRFGSDRLQPVGNDPGSPDETATLLVPALQSAAEAGARQVRVLSDTRFEDAVALRSALEALPLAISFERFGGPVPNVGIGRFEVPDQARPDAAPVAELEVHGGSPGDSIEVTVLEEDAPVATVRVAAPSAGLRATASVELPPPTRNGRVRYTARVSAPADGFADDDEAVSYANVGFEEGGLILVSFRPDWEPRYLLPVLEEVTGLAATGYLRAGPDRFVLMGRAIDRGAPVDSASVRRAAAEAAILVVHGFGEDAETWIDPLLTAGGRRLVLPLDANGAERAGVAVSDARGGEWYASADVPESPIAGALASVDLQGLPPLTNVLVAESPNREPVMQLQLRGAGAPENAFHLVDTPRGRLVVALASSYWRWAARAEGREAYRSLWSGLAGWLLAGERMAAAEPRPATWVVPRGESVAWRLPVDSVDTRIEVAAGADVVTDTVLSAGARAVTRELPPGAYTYAVFDVASGDSLSSGRFDVASTTLEMLPSVADPGLDELVASGNVNIESTGRPLRTFPWPYLLVLALLCGEWVVRRRTGLR